ncbi:polymeras-like protein II polypeptide D [Coccomyxa subellipsoidea C-169]|uniref:Polymeras-like protein II polypeptide D n=1 Tax=Coccomyxa subellipsoidea (strain C-169) TaxID=574566 RepID=I0YQK5_COCSC|nr:polymeras-like protein II polypeptide D [Coccomyxa subellipsoidea C-169]EIE20674.1 polymeras-like protein II polypeptide D [Coccomyxa subellipsoidea C-169]|eukprot:XP_005645218.1 polymeras-like protein II polypeptide D [Coccomyxa subellipsoidea C-169]
MGDAPQEEEENAAEGRFPSVFDSAQALTNGEVSAILAKIVAAKKQEDPAYQPNPLLAKTQEYVERFSGNKNEAVNQQIRMVLDAGEMTGFELASVANLQPETAEEARILIPSLDATQGDEPRFSDDTLQIVLDDVATYKQA